jgi:hypothetical protein
MRRPRFAIVAIVGYSFTTVFTTVKECDWSSEVVLFQMLAGAPSKFKGHAQPILPVLGLIFCASHLDVSVSCFHVAIHEVDDKIRRDDHQPSHHSGFCSRPHPSQHQHQ